ncbi:MAG: four helix bundle protein [Candidatus Magasanikbacteria bacterium CG_4_9_14_0_2_um_filter_42_11]|uniref:Four helix bundle protein n=1 Tax=Candidatus Magasanikbacteria bacterium CG_4_9_14_0_2_um_filter_42_11 TaxID=1974643 RepID=A0A2M8FB10_9BACT|nr:MAG: four helix bundle protein [Candidatus Magasanikbacteria bacterium CG10_big_fil_rev_8_21_14_0_10_43_9]PIY92594.1 MAG: four helix bundle protein [Candidatus Magasanikbacteria bacterium CG_4_10_14_0_8_um_filter_42_12]PJC52898.1 MAG: four helix bundle protein [Candidatus Magasanikbacteria bacterium CG_4_9_14_0_2_um_filter_42_11]
MGGGSKYKKFTELDVWRLSHTLRLRIYKMVMYLPQEEKYGMISQVCRSVSSIGANIAEGHGRFHYQENIQFCRQARGSLLETKDHLMFIRDAKLLVEVSPAGIDELLDVCDSIHAKLNGYIGYLKKRKQSDTN